MAPLSDLPCLGLCASIQPRNDIGQEDSQYHYHYSKRTRPYFARLVCRTFAGLVRHVSRSLVQYIKYYYTSSLLVLLITIHHMTGRQNSVSRQCMLQVDKTLCLVNISLCNKRQKTRPMFLYFRYNKQFNVWPR